MGDFRSFISARREPAVALRPTVDPAGWQAVSVGDPEEWSYALTERDVAELIDGIGAFRRKGAAIVNINQENFPLTALGDVLGDVRSELRDGRGFVLLRGFPVDRLDREEIAIAYLGLGQHIGSVIPQNGQGHVLGHVKDLGSDIADASTRVYVTRADVRFHIDGCDLVGLLCLQTAKAGGESRIASSVTVYNRMLETRQDLVEALCDEFYISKNGELNPGEPPWHKQPIFAFADGYLSARGVGDYIFKAQELPGVPPLTAAQLEAMDVYFETVEDCALDMTFGSGDIQLLNNRVIVHARRAFEDWPEPERKRHLLRLWLNDPGGRPVPDFLEKGRNRTGIRLAGVKLNVPLDVATPA
jgi:alpha-ketoglutarate-dependent taurine dioxygenase